MCMDVLTPRVCTTRTSALKFLKRTPDPLGLDAQSSAHCAVFGMEPGTSGRADILRAFLPNAFSAVFSWPKRIKYANSEQMLWPSFCSLTPVFQLSAHDTTGTIACTERCEGPTSHGLYFMNENLIPGADTWNISLHP